MTAIGDAIGKALGKSTNEFAGPATRLEARETARNVDGQDLSRLPIREGRRPSVTKALSLLTFRTSREVFDWKMVQS
ncbi:internal (core) protein [Enterobacter phage 03_vB_Eclo_IJM]|nr:internal (core) protein [Enterobacter phage 03_vB_Eclo_IJM]